MDLDVLADHHLEFLTLLPRYVLFNALVLQALCSQLQPFCQIWAFSNWTEMLSPHSCFHRHRVVKDKTDLVHKWTVFFLLFYECPLKVTRKSIASLMWFISCSHRMCGQDVIQWGIDVNINHLVWQEGGTVQKDLQLLLTWFLKWCRLLCHEIETSHYCSCGREWKRPTSDMWYLVKGPVLAQHVWSNTAEQRQQYRLKKKSVEGGWGGKKGRLRGGENKERKAAETRGPIDFRASLVFFCSLNCCPHSPFPLSLSPPPFNSLLPLSPFVEPSGWFGPCMPVVVVGWTGGGEGGDCSCRWLDHMWHCKPFHPGAALLKSSALHWLTPTRRPQA